MSKQETDLLRDLETRQGDEGRNAHKMALERVWFECVSFFAGQQYLKWNQSANTLEEPASPPWRSRYTANLILPIVQRAVAKVTADRPRCIVAPKTADRSDVAGARVGSKVIEHLFEVTEFDEEVRRMVTWAALTGTGFLKVIWDPDAGPVVSDLISLDDRELIEESENAEDSPDSIKGVASLLNAHLGECAVEAVSPFKIYTDAVDPSPGWGSATWVIESTERPLSYIKSRWPTRGKHIQAEEGRPHSWMERRLQSLISKSYFGGNPNRATDTATVVEMWDKPSPDYPKGRYSVVAGWIVLESRSNHYATELGVWNPYIHVNWVEQPARFWGTGLVENLIPSQREYNITRSQIIESKNMMSKPKWLVPRGCGISETAITSEPGEIIFYNGTSLPPSIVPPAPLPNYVEAHVTDLFKEMQIIAAQSDVTQARAPSSVRSGTAIQMLMEQDISVMSLFRNRLIDSVKASARLLLKLASTNWDIARSVKTLSTDYSYQVDMWKGADIRNNFDVRVVPSSGTESTATRRADLLDLINAGFLQSQNPQHQRAILEGFELFDVQSATHAMTQHYQVAEKENFAMKALPPKMPMVREFHDHRVHVETHQSLQNSGDYSALSPEHQAIIDQHVSQHQQILQQQMEAQMQMMQMQRGGPGNEPGVGSRPKRENEAPSQ